MFRLKNKNKTEIIALGGHWDKTKLNQIKKGPFKVLGVWFSENNDSYELNLKPKIAEIDRIMKTWSRFSISIKGKIVIIKTLILSRIINICSMVFVPQHFIMKIHQMLFSFLWGKDKRPKVKKDITTNDYEFGGLRMVNFENTITSIKATWIKRIYLSDSVTSESNFVNKWCHLAKKMLQIQNKDSLLQKTNIREKSNLPLNEFYQQIFKCWHDVYTVVPTSYIEILQEKLCNNTLIQVGGKPLNKEFDPFTRKGIICISDLVENKILISKDRLNEKFECNIPTMLYNSLISSIPIHWKEEISRNCKPMKYKTFEIPHLKKDLITITAKDMYTFLTYKPKFPIAVNKWIEYYPFMEKFEWSTLFKLPSVICSETKMQSFQYKILNRYITCNYNLYLWNLSTSQFCDDCQNVDTIEHFFVYCNTVKLFWDKVRELILEAFQVKLDLTVLEILLGIPCVRGSLFCQINFVILYSKWFVYTYKRQNTLSFSYFRNIMKNRIEDEIYILKMKSTSPNIDTLQHWNNLLICCKAGTLS